MFGILYQVTIALIATLLATTLLVVLGTLWRHRLRRLLVSVALLIPEIKAIHAERDRLVAQQESMQEQATRLQALKEWAEQRPRPYDFGARRERWEQRRAKLISVVNHKGGVGKSTLTANLGAILAARNHAVLCVDLDPQANLSTYMTPHVNEMTLDRTTGASSTAVFDHFLTTIHEGATDTFWSDFSINPTDGFTTEQLGGLLRVLPATMNLSVMNTMLLSAVIARTSIDPRFILLDYLLSSQDVFLYDYILFDLPPSFGIVADNALCVSDYYLVPMTPHQFATGGRDKLENQINSLYGMEMTSARLLGFVFNKVGGHGAYRTAITRFGDEPIAEIKESVTVAKLINDRKSCRALPPSNATRTQLEKMTDTVIERIKVLS